MKKVKITWQGALAVIGTVLLLIALICSLTGCSYEPHLCKYAGQSKISNVAIYMEGIGMMADRMATITMENGYVVVECYKPSKGYKIGMNCHTWDCSSHGQSIRRVN